MKRGRVLIVEDEFMIRVLLEDICDTANCDVVASCTTVADALEAIESTDFNVAVLDVNLQGETSEPIAHALRAAGKNVLVSTGSTPGDLPSAYDGFTVVQKPFHTTEVALLLSQTAF